MNYSIDSGIAPLGAVGHWQSCVRENLWPIHLKSSLNWLDSDLILNHYKIHEKMIENSASGIEGARPIIYVNLGATIKTVSASSSSADILTSEAKNYYDRIEEKLHSLTDQGESCEVIEEGAVKSALTVVRNLKEHSYSPPELSWHGGDAVVMLWALGYTTCAITITDGELGYVVRRNRKAIKMVDSIDINTFRLEDMR